MRYRKIPNIAFFYWGNSPMPWLNCLSLATFKHCHPETPAILCVPHDREYVAPTWRSHEQKLPYEGQDYLPYAKGIADDVYVVNFEWIGLPPGMPDVHQADMLRHWAMYNWGGIWSDMDVLYLGSVDRLSVSDEVQVGFCYHPKKKYYSTGFVLSEFGNAVYERISEASVKEYSKDEYQKVGPNLVRRLFPDITKIKGGEVVEAIPMQQIYPYAYNEMGQLWDKGDVGRIGDDTVAIHWFGGAKESMRARNRITPDNPEVLHELLEPDVLCLHSHID
jgi:hypothetical protein